MKKIVIRPIEVFLLISDHYDKSADQRDQQRKALRDIQHALGTERQCQSTKQKKVKEA